MGSRSLRCSSLSTTTGLTRGGLIEPCRVICVAPGSPEHRDCVAGFKKRKTTTYCCFHYFNVDPEKPVSIPLDEYVAMRRAEGSKEATYSAKRCDLLMERTAQDLRDGFPEMGTENRAGGGEKRGRGDAEKAAPPAGSCVPAVKRLAGASRDARPAKMAKTGPRGGGAGAAAAAKATGPQPRLSVFSRTWQTWGRAWTSRSWGSCVS